MDAILLRVRGNISDGVLIPNVPGNTLTNLCYRAGLIGEEGFTTRRVRKAIKHLRIRVVIVWREKTDGVNDGARALRHLQHLRQAVRAGVIGSVADDH